MITYLFTKTPLVFLVQSFWRDEAFTYLLAKKSIIDIVFLTAKDFNPPLYYLLIKFWENLPAGRQVFGHSEIALRSLSLIFYWLTVYIGFLFINQILKINVKKSFFYLLLFIFSPILTYYAFEARMYMLLTFFSTLSFYALYKNNRKTYLLATILGLYTHYFMIIVVLSQIAFIFIVNKKKNLALIKNSIYSLILFVPWLIFVFIQKGRQTDSFWIKKASLGTLINSFGLIYTGYEVDFKFYSHSITLLSLLLMLLIAIGYLIFKKQDKESQRLFNFLLSWTIFPIIIVFLISLFKPIFLARYLIFTSVGFILLLILVIEKMNLLAKFFVLCLLFYLTINFQKLNIKNRQKANLRNTIHQIKILANKNDLLYVTSELDFHVAQYYYNENKVFIYGKTYEQIPNYVGKILIPKEKITRSLPLYPQKAFILKADGSYDIQAMY